MVLLRGTLGTSILVLLAGLAFLAPISQVAAHPQRPLFGASLTGAAEVPGPGDPDGIGVAIIHFHHNHGRAQGRVCFNIVVADITLPITGAHIHRGAANEAGPIVVSLFTGSHQDGVLNGCVRAGHAVLRAIHQDPAAYYVNVHNQEFPGGALRGQLFLPD